MKQTSLFSTLTLVAAILANGCSRHVQKQRAEAAPVLVAESAAADVPVRMDPPLVGHVVPSSTVTVHPQIGGVLQAVHFQDGQAVKKGSLLFTIDPQPEQAALVAAQAALERDQAQLVNAKIQFDREQKLCGQQLDSLDALDTSRATMDALKGTVRADEAAVTNATLNLGYTEIHSPIDGVAGAVQFDPGNVVKAQSDTLVTVNQIKPIAVQFGVLEQFLPEIRKEMQTHPLKVTVLFDGLTGPPPQGEVTFVDNSVDPNTGMIQLKATFPNKNSRLWPGEFVTVNLTLTELTNAVVVPSPAVQTGQNGDFVYVVKPDETAEAQPVTSGITYDGKTVIQSGLTPGETVVTDGQLRLTPGARVSVKNPETKYAAVNERSVTKNVRSPHGSSKPIPVAQTGALPDRRLAVGEAGSMPTRDAARDQSALHLSVLPGKAAVSAEKGLAGGA